MNPGSAAMTCVGCVFCSDAAVRARLAGIVVAELQRSAEHNRVRAGVRERVAMAELGLQTLSMFGGYNIVADADLAGAQ